MDGICRRIRDSTHKLLPMDGSVDSSKKENHNRGKISLLTTETLLIFTEYAVIRKRILFYLWVGEGVKGIENKKAEKLGEDLIDELCA